MLQEAAIYARKRHRSQGTAGDPHLYPQRAKRHAHVLREEALSGGIRQTLPPALFRRHHRRKEGCILRGLHSGNEYIQTQVLPAIGGKILSGYDKIGHYDFIYRNRVIKPALVGLAGAWISGGIEFNWPQHHRPTTFLPLEASLEENPDGSKTLWTGEVDPFIG